MQLVKFLYSISKGRIVAVFTAGLISGLANTYLLLLIRDVLSPRPHTGSALVPFIVTAAIALTAGVLSQVLLIRLTQQAVYRLRVQFSSAVMSAPLERLERLGVHRLLATLTEDVRSLSQAVTSLPNFVVDVVTIFGCLIALAVVSGPVFTVTVAGTALSILGVELLLRRVHRIFREARENEDALLRSFHAMTVGIKELKLHRGRRHDFMNRHLVGAARELRDQNVDAGVRASVAHGYGRMVQQASMAVILFVLAAVLELPGHVLVSYVLVTIFLAMPMQHFMSRLPDLMRGDVALEKIRQMDLMMLIDGDEEAMPYDGRPAAADGRLELAGVSYTYQGELAPSSPLGTSLPPRPFGRPGPGGNPGGPGGRHQPPGQPPGPPPMSGFKLGPIDLVLEPGQITFVVGGNGSGKSTLAKLITGLYAPQTGSLTFNGEPIGHDNAEWFRQNCSAIFTDFHLFEDYLGFDRPGIDDEVRRYLVDLQLDQKVTVQDGRLSTVALSQGQRKRLALLTALLEDRPIYVFDEWAADQEPGFRDVFYTRIITELKSRGKTVVVITHDDRYFDCADQIVRLDYGRREDIAVTQDSRPGAR